MPVTAPVEIGADAGVTKAARTFCTPFEVPLGCPNGWTLETHTGDAGELAVPVCCDGPAGPYYEP
jgi:hypothetical protein